MTITQIEKLQLLSEILTDTYEVYFEIIRKNGICPASIKCQAKIDKYEKMQKDIMEEVHSND